MVFLPTGPKIKSYKKNALVKILLSWVNFESGAKETWEKQPRKAQLNILFSAIKTMEK